ncbi:MAG TPA: cupin domain-containing protein, partial [Burkholderiaceae bacterium]|nr:cupin domain-containing protein [Burkholderiaceae bacterium]
MSDVLKAVRLDGALYLNAEFSAPWCMRGRYGRASVRQRLAGAEHVVYFHLLTEGSCKVRLADGGDVLDVAAGDLVLFPQDDRHLMGSDLHMAPLDAENWNGGNDPAPGLEPFRYGGGGTVTRFVCGFLACNRSMCRPLLDALPRVLRIPIGDG